MYRTYSQMGMIPYKVQAALLQPDAVFRENEGQRGENVCLIFFGVWPYKIIIGGLSIFARPVSD